MTRQRLQEILDGFERLSILVVGDFFLDEYLITDPALTEISLETGLEAHQVIGRRCSPGAAGTVTNNLRALGVGCIHALSIIGEDGNGYDLKKRLVETGVNTSALIETPDYPTPTYTKPMAREASGEERELNRLDIKKRHPMSADLEDRIIESLRDLMPRLDGVIVGDQVQEHNYGVVTDRVRDTLADLAEANPGTMVLIDSRSRIGAYRNAVLKPNRHEAVTAIHPEYEGPVDQAVVESCGRTLFAQTRRPVYITLSQEGMMLITENGIEHIPAVRVTGTIDPVGAGDSTSAGITAGRCAGATWSEAALIGNLAASVTVQQLGTTGTATREQVAESINLING